jgi:RHS repeat-associated protein
MCAASYVYDPVGNRTQKTSSIPGYPGGLSNYNANDQLSTDTYDANGNTTASVGLGYAYDFENHLIRAGAGITRVYDGDGNRVSKTVAGVTTKYLVDTQSPTGYAQVVSEAIAGNTTQPYDYARAYVYGLELVSEYRQFVSNNQGGTQISYYVYDGHGSVRALTNPSGAVTDTYDYDAFGNLLHSTFTGSAPTPNNYLFAGEQFDPDLGMYFLRARYLNVSTGRFWSMDTFEGDDEAPLSLHKYHYCSGDPVDLTDPTGKDFADISISLAIQGTISGAMSGLLTYAVTRNVKQSLAAAAGGFVIGVAFGAVGQAAKALYVARTAGALALATEDVVITADKMRYLLVLDAGKANGFRLLGYTVDNADELQSILAASRDFITEETEKTVTKYGTKYVVDMEIVGASGMKGVVQVVWQQDVGTALFRLITAIPKPFGVLY